MRDIGKTALFFFDPLFPGSQAHKSFMGNAQKTFIVAISESGYVR
jgi:hypothetical protein